MRRSRPGSASSGLIILSFIPCSSFLVMAMTGNDARPPVVANIIYSRAFRGSRDLPHACERRFQAGSSRHEMVMWFSPFVFNPFTYHAGNDVRRGGNEPDLTDDRLRLEH